MRAAALLLAGLLLPRPGLAQGDRCVFQIDFVGDTGRRVETPAGINYYGGGGVRLSCRGTTVKMSSDSIAAYGGKVVEFVNKVRYEDSTVVMTATRGTYFKDGERWEARGNVVTKNSRNGSTLNGPSLDYYRAVVGVRDTVELYAVGRPTISYAPADSAGRRAEPYIIVGDRVRMKGNDRLWAAGRVTINRSDFAAQGDSLRLDTGAGSDGTLIGKPQMRGLGRNQFTLTGDRIDLTFDRQELTYVKAVGNGHAVSTDLDLTADQIGLDLESKLLVQTLAWGAQHHPVANAADYAIRGDSLAIDTPGQLLTETRAFGSAWVGGKVDSLTHERDWMTGDTIVVGFMQRDSAGTTRTQVQKLAASGHAHSWYRVSDSNRPGPPSINYSRGDFILVQMKSDGNRGVDRVDFRGQVDGLQLEPLAPPDSSADSTKAKPAKGQEQGTR